MVTYESNLKEPNSITLEECEKIYMDIVHQIEIRQDCMAERLFTEMQKCAISYAGIRANWFNLSYGERAAADGDRTRKHDLFIRAKDRLAEYMYENKMNIDWDDALGNHRKRIGDFACYMVFLIAVSER